MSECNHCGAPVTVGDACRYCGTVSLKRRDHGGAQITIRQNAIAANVTPAMLEAMLEAVALAPGKPVFS